MNKYQISQAIIQLYTEFFRQVSLNKNFIFKRWSKDIKTISKFSDWLLKEYKQEQIGILFLIDFFKFQFSRYAGVNTQYGRNIIMLNWLIGDKAKKAWLDQKHSKKWIIKVKLKKSVEIQLIKAFEEQIKNSKSSALKSRYLKIHEHEEIAKQRFFNTKKGFLYCHGTTTLYNKKSSLCSECLFKEDCQESLKSQFPKLYDIRNE